MKRRESMTFTFHYQPWEPTFSVPPGRKPRRQRKPWMTAVNGDWVPGLQYTFIGACWAAWRLQRKLRQKEEA